MGVLTIIHTIDRKNRIIKMVIEVLRTFLDNSLSPFFNPITEKIRETIQTKTNKSQLPPNIYSLNVKLPNKLLGKKGIKTKKTGASIIIK
jgi:hypothetical protein